MFLKYKKWHKENFNFCCLRGYGCWGNLEQHHVKHVGTGNNRLKNIPEHLTVITMCEKHHKEFDEFTNKQFIEMYNFNPFEQVVDQILLYFHDHVINKTLDEEFRKVEYDY